MRVRSLPLAALVLTFTLAASAFGGTAWAGIAPGQGNEQIPDACPGESNPGFQESGTTCNSEPSAPPIEPEVDVQPSGGAPTGVDANPAVEIDHEPTLGSGPTPLDIVAPSGTTFEVGGVTSGVGAGAPAVSGNLPFTGIGLELLFFGGLISLVAGLAAHRQGARAARSCA